MAINGIPHALDDLRKVKADLEKLQKDAPRMAGVEAVKWIHGNFAKQGYKGRRWKKRKDSTNKRYDSRSGVKGSVFNSANPVLDQTGNLKDSIRAKTEGNKTYIGFNTDKVPYGVIHNEGGTIEIGSKTRSVYFMGNRFAQRGKHNRAENLIYKAHIIRMPQRQFMPKPNDPIDPSLMKAVTSKINFERNKIMSIFKKK